MLKVTSLVLPLFLFSPPPFYQAFLALHMTSPHLLLFSTYSLHGDGRCPSGHPHLTSTALSCSRSPRPVISHFPQTSCCISNCSSLLLLLLIWPSMVVPKLWLKTSSSLFAWLISPMGSVVPRCNASHISLYLRPVVHPQATLQHCLLTRGYPSMSLTQNDHPSPTTGLF